MRNNAKPALERFAVRNPSPVERCRREPTRRISITAIANGSPGKANPPFPGEAIIEILQIRQSNGRSQNK
jgi:hypothetical protein